MTIVLKVLFVAIAVIAPFLMLWSVWLERKRRDELVALALRLCDPQSWTVEPTIYYIGSRRPRMAWAGQMVGRLDGRPIHFVNYPGTSETTSLWVGFPVTADLEIASRFNTPKALNKTTAEVLEKIYSTGDFRGLQVISTRVSHQRRFLFHPRYFGDDPGLQLNRLRPKHLEPEKIRRDVALLVELGHALSAAAPEARQ